MICFLDISKMFIKLEIVKMCTYEKLLKGAISDFYPKVLLYSPGLFRITIQFSVLGYGKGQGLVEQL